MEEGIDRNADPFHARDRSHVPAAEQGTRYVNDRRHYRPERREALHVGRTVIQNRALLRLRPLPIAHYQLTHLLLFSSIDMGKICDGESPEQIVRAGQFAAV